ncbi:hypothetical protein COLO4_22694 [Corchorus olitorius]|uniref:Uncharacterized protein n=1 Tax=Corchorus olitorius TaxID=93759 RepID=A0A1R3IKR5_9ROSI|nr:hypothetical protein COLO4_22694 [Corchorus olitorius]
MTFLPFCTSLLEESAVESTSEDRRSPRPNLFFSYIATETVLLRPKYSNCQNRVASYR